MTTVTEIIQLFTNDWTPELHPRDDSGKFTEKVGSVLGDVADVFSDFANEDTRERVDSLSRTWAGWPTDSNTRPMWTAASEITHNENDPGDITGTPLIDEFGADVDQEDVDAMKDFAEFTEEKLREEYGDSITAHRFLHSGEISSEEEGDSEIIEKVKNGEKVQPRTLGSWTTNKDKIPEIIDAVAPNANQEDIDNAIVVTKEIPVDKVMAHHETTPELAHTEQEEVVAMLGYTDDLSENEEVETVAEMAQS